MTEVDLIRKLQARLPLQRGSLILGIGDDAAIYRPKHSRDDLLFTTDLMVQGVHFRPSHSLEYVGYKALARGLSDIAAMGGEPRFCLVSLALADIGKAEAFYRGLLRLAERTGTILAGGDLSRTRLNTIDIVVCGSVPRGKALRRDQARPGDSLYVSAPLGRAASRRYHDRPQPRLALARKLRGKASGCMDLSDGISLDLKRFCEASAVSARLHYVPIFPGATLEQALHGGEDYELLYTAPPHAIVPGIRIGEIVEGDSGVWFQDRPLLALGHDHFANAKLIS